MKPSDIRIQAKITLQDLLLEIILANQIKQYDDPHAAFQQFRDRLVDILQYEMKVPGDVGDLSLLIQAESVEMAQVFCDRVSARLTEILK